MKRILLAAALLTSSSLFATPLHQVKGLSVKTGPSFEAAKVAINRLHNPHGDVATETSAPIFIFPVVGSLAGGNNTYYRSETTIINNRSVSQTVEMFFFASGTSNCARPSKVITIPAESWVAYNDIVADIFQTTGIGSLIIQAIDGNDNYDDNGDIDGTSRIWTPSPFSGGTLSQTFSAASFNPDNGVTALSAYGLRNGEGFHTNLGILNYSSQARDFTAVLNGENFVSQFDFSINSCSFQQFRVTNGDYGIMQLQVNAHDDLGEWYGYGSSVDEVTANNWSSVMR